MKKLFAANKYRSVALALAASQAPARRSQKLRKRAHQNRLAADADNQN